MNGPVLRDIHLPSAPWWPLAPGWWALLGLLLLIVVGVAWWFWRNVKRGPLRAALREVDALAAAHAADRNDGELAEGASRLLRRIALRIDPAAAAQDGIAWRVFIHLHARDADTAGALDALAAQRFRAQPSLDAPVLLTALRKWCRAALSARVPAHRRAKSDAPQARGNAAPASTPPQGSAA